MKDLNEKKWKRRQKCIRPNMALFWKQTISFGLSFWECKNIEKRRAGEKRKREEEEDEDEKRRRKKDQKEQRYGICMDCMDYYGFV